MKRALVHSAITIVLSVTFIASSWAKCVVKDAKYTLKANSAYSLQFSQGIREKKPTIVVQFASTASSARADFFMDIGSGYSEAYLYPVDQDPAVRQATQMVSVELPIFSFDRKLNVSSEMLRLNDEAPKFLFVPKLGQALYYYPARFLVNETRKELMQLGLFELSNCK